MSIFAGSILHVGGNHVIDRLQSAGLGNVKVAMETVREIGNTLVVDKVPQEPTFTFSMEATDVSNDMLAFLLGKSGAEASGSSPSSGDPDGTVYDPTLCQFVNIVSPWKDPATGSAGVVNAGHLVPGFYPTKISYSYGVTANATETVDLEGAEFYYGEWSPIEEQVVAGAGQTAFPTTHVPVKYRVGGETSNIVRYVFGVLVNGSLQTEGIDYTVNNGAINDGVVQTITFTNAPGNGAVVKFCYFASDLNASYPQTVHTSTLVKPGAVRGRNILVFLGAGANRIQLGGVQTFTQDFTITGEIDRQLGSLVPVGRTITGFDCTGTIGFRARDKNAFFAAISEATGVPRSEVVGWLNLNPVPLTVQIQNPKNPAQIIKSVAIADARIQVPGTPGRVNAATDFSLEYESANGTFLEYKGAFLP